MKIKGPFKKQKPLKEKLKLKYKFKKLIYGFVIINNSFKKNKITPKFYNLSLKQILI